MKANIKKVAQEAGVSTATVSRVVNETGYVSDDVKKRVYEAIEALNYRPNAIARSLKQDRTHTIGIVVPDISNEYFMLIARGIEDAVQAEGYHLIFGSSGENPEKEDHLLRLMQEKRADAIVLAAAGNPAGRLDHLVRTGTPVVLIDRRLGEEIRQLDLFVEDNVSTAEALTARLIAEGHRCIGVIHGGAIASTAVERLEGFRRGLAAAGLAFDERLACDGKYSVEGGAAAARYFLGLPERPTAILSLNNKMSFGAMLELRRQGVAIPDGMAVASYGAVEAAQLLRCPGIWYADQDPYAMGQAAGEQLLLRLDRTAEQGASVRRVFAPVLRCLR